jgi:multidrug efflux pump subunit AcrA (membrane-fusion protein)
MWMRVLIRSSLAILLGVCCLVWLTPLAAAPRNGEKGSAQPPQPSSPSAETALAGKFFCSLKRPIILPFKGIIAAVMVQSGQRVEAGEVLARYRLTPEALLQIRQRLSPSRLGELEAKMAGVQRNLLTLEAKKKELTQLGQQKLAPPQGVEQAHREVQLLVKERSAIQESLHREQQLAQDDLVLLKKQLGNAVSRGQIPQEGTLTAPIRGHVIWVHPDLREGSELDPGQPAFQVGVMNPMLVRAQAYEIEALQLAIGDTATITTESLPGKEFEGKVTRIAWSAMTAGLDQPSYYEVQLTVPNPDLILKDGLKARIFLRKSQVAKRQVNE